jgi:hypothetical protein
MALQWSTSQRVPDSMTAALRDLEKYASADTSGAWDEDPKYFVIDALS